MKKISHIIITLFLLSTIISCEKIVKFDVKDYPPELTLNAFIGARDTIKAFVEKSSISLTVDDKKWNEDLISVELYEDGEFIENLKSVKLLGEYHGSINGTPIYDTLTRFHSTHIAKISSSYTIKASHPKCETVSGSTTPLPTPVLITAIDTTELFIAIERTEMYFTFLDPPDTENYYMAIVNTKLGYSLPEGHPKYDPEKKQVVIDDGFENDVYIYDLFSASDQNPNDFITGTPRNRFNVFNDQQIDPTNAKVPFQFYPSYSYPLKKIDTCKGEFYIMSAQLLNITKEMYQYLVTVDKQLHYDNNIFTEPVIAFDNIENGVGIVGGYAQSSKQISIGKYPDDNVEYMSYSEYWRSKY